MVALWTGIARYMRYSCTMSHGRNKGLGRPYLPYLSQLMF